MFGEKLKRIESGIGSIEEEKEGIERSIKAAVKEVKEKMGRKGKGTMGDGMKSVRGRRWR